jgi:fluoroquinolone resistance protein
MKSPFPNIEYNSEQFKSIDCRSTEVRSVEFNECKFNRCIFREASLIGCKFHNCTFLDCDFSLTKLNNSLFTEVVFKNCQLIGINWMETSLAKKNFLKTVDFLKCVLNYSTFTGLHLGKIQMTDCIAHSVDFTDADLSLADCSRTDFSESRFHNTNLSETNLTDATNYSISVIDNNVKKAIFSLPEAMSLLYSLDIVLTDSSDRAE